jgi:hypothetical protein
MFHVFLLNYANKLRAILALFGKLNVKSEFYDALFGTKIIDKKQAKTTKNILAGPCQKHDRHWLLGFIRNPIGQIIFKLNKGNEC